MLRGSESMIGEEQLHRLIDRLYESAVDDHQWASGIQDVAEAFGCEVGGLTLHEMPSTALRVRHHFGHDEQFRRSYAALATTADMAPVWRMTAAGLPARVLTQEVA